MTLDAARAEVARVVGRGLDAEQYEEQSPFTPRAKKIITLALREALDLGDGPVATEHVLLAIDREGAGGLCRS